MTQMLYVVTEYYIDPEEDEYCEERYIDAFHSLDEADDECIRLNESTDDCYEYGVTFVVRESNEEV